MTDETVPEAKAPSNFIKNFIEEDLRTGKHQTIKTRFPPEPNGYLHIGHVKSILLNYGIAQAYNGKFNMRFDDTNPLKEEQEFIDAILEDIKWLGADWEDRLFYASDYFPQLYDWAIQLIKDGKAYVDDLSAEEIREYRGTLTEPGRESPYRDRSIEENLDLFDLAGPNQYVDVRIQPAGQLHAPQERVGIRDGQHHEADLPRALPEARHRGRMAFPDR